MNKYICYTATHKTAGLIYVGITSQKLLKRKSDHGSKAKAGKKGLFQDALRKYGVNAFEWQKVAEGSKDVMELLERVLIYEWDTVNPDFGYNKVGGADPAQIRYQLKKTSWKHFGPPWNKPPLGYEQHGDMLDNDDDFVEALELLNDIEGRIRIFCSDHYHPDFESKIEGWIDQLQKTKQMEKS